MDPFQEVKHFYLSLLQVEKDFYSIIEPLQLFKLGEHAPGSVVYSIEDAYDLLCHVGDLVQPQPSSAEGEAATSEKMECSELFKLISILPDPLAARCKGVMDRDRFQWKITLEVVASVFINWGVDLKSLNLHELLEKVCGPSFNAELWTPATNNAEVPTNSNVVAVLDAIRLRTPSDQELPVNQKNMILKILIWGAMAKTKKLTRFHYTKAMTAVLDSYANWDSMQIYSTLKYLDLGSLTEDEAVFVVCDLFNFRIDRLKAFEVMALTVVLNKLLRLKFMEKRSLLELTDNLNVMKAFKESYSKNTIHRIISVVRSLLVKAHRNTELSKETLEKVLSWARELYASFKLSTVLLTDLEVFQIKESLSRLFSECSILAKQYKLYNLFDCEDD